MGLDLRKVEHFVAVVEERSMTRAAARLHLSQQALSMSMRALERELGVPLLDRSRRGVVLLASGEALYADAVPLLAAATAAVGRARRADRGEPELLRIGHTPAVTGIEVTEMLAGAPAHGASVQVVALPSDELNERLRDRSVDIGLSRATAPAAGLAGQVVARHRLRLAVRAGHRLAHRHAVTLPELAAETLIVGAPPGVCAYTDLLLGLCRRADPGGGLVRTVVDHQHRRPASGQCLDHGRPDEPGASGHDRPLDSHAPPPRPLPPGSQEIIASVQVLRHQRCERLRRSAHCVASHGLPTAQVVLVISQGGVVGIVGG